MFVLVVGVGTRVDTPHPVEERYDNNKGQRCLKSEGEEAVPLRETKH